MFIAVPTTFCHLSPSWIIISIRSILISSYCLNLRLVSGVFCTFMDKNCVCVSILFHTCYISRQPFSSWPDSRYLRWLQIMNLSGVMFLFFIVILKSKNCRQHTILRHLSPWSPLYVRQWVRNPCKTNEELLHFVWNTLLCQTGIWRYKKWLFRRRHVYYNFCR